MSNLLDLNLLPIARYAGRDHPESLSLSASEAPRRSARGREKDRLILYLVLGGNAPLAPAKQDQVLAELTKLYFKTPGAATSAMRKIALELNDLLLDRNLQLASSSRQSVGLLVQVLVRGQQVYLAQSGSTHAFLIKAKEVQHFHDPVQSEPPATMQQGLGQSRVTPLSFFQATLQPNDTLIISAQPSPEWSTDSLGGIHGQGPESLRRRLLSQSMADLNAVLIQAKPGKGNFYFFRTSAPQVAKPVVGREPRPGIAESKRPQPVSMTEADHKQAEEQIAVGEEELSISKALPAQPTYEAETLPQSEIAAPALEQPTPSEVVLDEPSTPIQSAAKETSSDELSIKSTTPRRKSHLEPVWNFFIAIGIPIVKIWRGISKGLHELFGRMLPGSPFITLPSSAMAFIALAIPVVIVTVSSITYFRLGRSAQYEILYSQAERMASQAFEQTDLLTKRAELEATLDILQRVEHYQVTPDTQALRVQIRRALDELDLVRRVDYKPAIIGGLQATVNITRIVVSYYDLYLLDNNGGNVIHAKSTDQGYEIDPSFECGLGSSGGVTIGSIVEIAAWPAGYDPKASIVALDATGNLLFCSPDGSPHPTQLMPPTSEAWGRIVAFTLDQGDLYLLDLPSNEVWIYWRSNVNEEPTMYFDQEIPALQDVNDLEVNRSDLYLLHKDGRLTLCLYGTMDVTPTRCSNVSYIDFRPGRENSALIPPAPFTQIAASPPPDPSLFLLEPISHAVYHFSLRNLAFQRQFLPENPLSSSGSTQVKDATAFAVDTIHRNLFLAIGNEIFYAIMP